jgi:hypothetical protein
MKFYRAIEKRTDLRVAYIVTDDDRRFQAVARRIPIGSKKKATRRVNLLVLAPREVRVDAMFAFELQF